MAFQQNLPCFLLFLSSVLLSLPTSSSLLGSLRRGSSLSVEKPEDVLVSPNGVFSAGFYAVGDNAFAFAIWFSKPPCYFKDCTLVWMANRNYPVNGRRSKLSLRKNGNLILEDAATQFPVWSTNTFSLASELKLDDLGNLVLRDLNRTTLWQSFNHPTDTLLPQQPFTRDMKLVSSRSQSNYSSGFYQLFFDDDNLLRLLFDNSIISSTYWPKPYLNSWEAGRSTYNSSRVAVLSSYGKFKSSDDLTFRSTDYGLNHQRRLIVDFDGNLRLYSREEGESSWSVTWQAIQEPCTIHGICGENALCTYVRDSERKCSCLPGYKVKNLTRIDLSMGCEAKFEIPTSAKEADFRPLHHVEFYGYDYLYIENATLKMCQENCSNNSICKGFQYKYNPDKGLYLCYPKSQLLNGYLSPGFEGDIYLKLPRVNLSFYNQSLIATSKGCKNETEMLQRRYRQRHENGLLKFLVWFACAVGVFEIFCVSLVFFFLHRSNQRDAVSQGYLLTSTGFKRFTYIELKKATKNFTEEIGRGGGGAVYKGVLSDSRVAAVKRLNEANQGEAEFLAEIQTIGKVNHMNLIEMWGYCIERKHRILVYEFMEHGSVADNLSSDNFDWKQRFNIALGTAKGLAYLHEDCLDWVLHCDIKPQNILLDSNYQPKVSDFGLSKLLNRGELHNSSFSRIRGTRGYMAPEWVFNLPITSKVDVYSYGVVLLEMVTGKSPATNIEATSSEGEIERTRLVKWVREKKNGSSSEAFWMEEIIDPKLKGNYNVHSLEILVSVALQCVEEERDARPTMSQVVEMLLEKDDIPN